MALPAGRSAPTYAEAAAVATVSRWESKTLRHRVFVSAMYTFLFLSSLVLLMPFYWLVSTSLKVQGMEFQVPPQWIPNPVRWQNYARAFQVGLPLHLFFRNTTIITALNLVGTLISASMAGYAFARLRFPLRGPLFILVLSTLMLPDIVTLIPSYLLFRYIHWIDTFFPLFVPSFLGGGAFSIFLCRQFFMTIPTELDEAARIDGAGNWNIYFRIILPLSGPVLATVAVFAFLTHWNAFVGPLIYINSMENMTLAVGLKAFQGRTMTQWNVMMAVATLMIVPVMVIFFAAQRYFMRGVVMTGLTGR